MKASADLGCVHAIHGLDCMLANDKGVVKDPIFAVAQYNLGVTLEYPFSQHKLFYGEGITERIKLKLFSCIVWQLNKAMHNLNIITAGVWKMVLALSRIV